MNPQEVGDYLAGRLSAADSERIARELDALPAEELERMLGGDPAGLEPRAPGGAGAPRSVGFTPAPRHFAVGRVLGNGATGEVLAADDRLLGREVALKRLRLRGPDESLDGFLARAAAFRREAALTAALEHPGVVPVHDVGISAHGEPAFAMKRLDGQALTVLLASDPPGPARVADIAIRVADAIGYAHAQGVVHRDLKPDHVWIGRHGEVTVIDWGLAARSGEDARRCGTPGWMAPEQDAGAAADPRMDVWAIGGLIQAMLPGRGPRGLAAIARHCRAQDPSARYADGAAVAADLRRWLEHGLSLAERPGALMRGWTALRRRPALALSAVLGLVLGGAAVWLPLADAERQRTAARAAVRELADATAGDLAAIAALRQRLAPLASAHPDLADVRVAAARLDAASRVLEDAARQRLLADTLDALDRSWRVRGPWPDEPVQLSAALDVAGAFALHGAACPVEQHPEAARLRRALIQLQRARLTSGQQPDARIPAVLARCQDPAWSALGRVIAGAVLETHDLAAPPGADLDLALAAPATAELVLATFGPDARLVSAARDLLDADPGAFWPRICLARDAVQRADWPAARLHALIALGRESASLWPRLALGYAALAAGDWGGLLAEATSAAAANAEHLEAGVMQAIALARLGSRDQAVARFTNLRAAGHLRWHQAHRHGHPMELLADAAVAAGLGLGEAAPELTPLVPVR